MRKSRAALAALALAAYALSAHAVGTIKNSKNRITFEISGAENGDSEVFSMQGLYSGRCWSPSASWDSASIDLETSTPRPGGAATVWSDVGVAAFVTMTADVAWTAIEGGYGDFRFEVSSAGASADVLCDFRRARQ